MNKRTTRFYRKNEKEVMEALGLKGTVNSGAGWIEKEDGQNEYLICQLKSTDAQSISIKQKDIRILEENAAVAHKMPMFAIQFLNTGEVWLMAKPQDFTDVAEYITTGKAEKREALLDITDCKKQSVNRPKRVIKSAHNAREKFYEEEKEKYERRKRKR